jgi:hypothetical protein
LCGLQGPGDLRVHLDGSRPFARLRKAGPEDHGRNGRAGRTNYEADYAGTFRGGRLLQHALYSVAAVGLLKPLNPKPRVLRGVYYFPTRKGRASRREISRPSAAELSELLTHLCRVVQLGAFICTSDDGDCKFCKHGKACLSGAEQSGNKMGT